MTIFYKYKNIKRADGVETKLPYIPVEIKNGEGTLRFETMALLDSGADISILPLDLAELLNLDLSGKREVANGIGGEVEVVNSKIFVKVSKGHENYEFEIPIQVLMVKSKAPLILGRDGFFDKFKITFDHYAEKIGLKRIIIGNRAVSHS